MQSPLAENPIHADITSSIRYKIGIFIETLTPNLAYIKLRAPKDF